MNKLPRIFIAGFLAIGLALPSPAHALRPELDRSGLEEIFSVLAEESRYEAVSLDEVPRFRDRLGDTAPQYARRLVRDNQAPGIIYLIKNEIPAEQTTLGGTRGKGWYPFPTKNYAWREYFGARLARELGANAADLVIPDLKERETLARYAGVEPEGLYLAQLTLSYRSDSPEVVQTDFRKSFTRNLVIAVLLRKLDFHDGNLGSLADVESLLMSFDTDLILLEEMADMLRYAPNFIGNYFQLHHRGNRVVLKQLFDRIDPEELRQAVHDVETFPLEDWLDQMRRTPGIPWAKIKPLADRLRAQQKSIRDDFQNLMDRLLVHPAVTDIQEGDRRFVVRMQEVLTPTTLAGLEERRERVLQKLGNEIGQLTQFPLTIIRTGGRKGIRVAYEDVTEGIIVGGFIPMSQLLDIPADWIPPLKIRRWVKARQKQKGWLLARVKDISRNRKSAQPVYFASQVPIARFLSDLLEDGADPRGWLVDAYHDVNRWKNISREGRAQILRWLAEHTEGVRDPEPLKRMFEWLAPSLAETAEARQWAEKGMKALAAQGQQSLAPRTPAPHIRWADGALRFDHPVSEPVDDLWPEEDRRAVELEVKKLVSTFYARNKAAKYSRRTPVRIIARRESHVARPPNLRIRDPMKWQPVNGNGLVAVEEDAAGSVLVVPLDDGFLDLLRSQHDGKLQHFVRSGDLLHLQASFYAAMRQLTSTGLEERQFQSADELVQFLEQTRPQRVAHPEKAGGTHFYTTLYPDLPLVEKIPHTDQVMRSVRLAQERLGGLTLGFVVWEQASRRRIFMESVSSLKVTLEREAAARNLDKGRALLQRFFELTTNIVRRGVLDWDAKLENYGVTPDGRVVLLDIGGLVKVEDALEEPDFEEADLAFFRKTLGKGVPAELSADYQALEAQFGFDPLHVMETLESQKDQDPPQPVQWIPSFRTGLEEGPRHRVAVIGAGPAGIGVAQSLVDLGDEVDLFDEKALYGGLAVFGVYPNKEDPMKLAYRFKSLGPTVVMPGVHFYGGVRVGKDGDLTLDDLRQLGYSAVVVAIGAEGSKPLRIPGERPGLPGLYQAKDLVAFYQGDPAASGLDPRLGSISILIGIGNVTVDTTHYAIHRRDYEAVDRFVQSLTREEQKKLLQSLKQRLPEEGQLRRNLGFYRPGVGRTVDVDKLREVLQRADLGEFRERLEQAWESTADIPSTREVYWVARRGPEQKAFEPKEVDVLAPYIDLDDLRAELRRVAPELGWDPADAEAMEQRLHQLLFGHPKTGMLQGNPAEKLKRFGTRLGLDEARIRMRFLLRGHSIEGDHADGIVFARNRMDGGRLEETNELADKQQLFGKEPVDSVVLSIGNEHDEDFGIQTRRGLFETRVDRLVGEGPSPLSRYFEAADSEGLFLTGWARTPSTGKVGEAMSDGRNTVQIAVAPYLSERSDSRRDARVLAAQRADLNRILAEKGIQAVSGGQATALPRLVHPKWLSAQRPG